MSCVLYTSVQGTHNRTLITLTSIHVLWKGRGGGRGGGIGERREEGKESEEEERNDGGEITITTVLATSGFQ